MGMNSEIWYAYFDIVIEEMVHKCLYCDNTIEENEEICVACELSIELTDALAAMAEA